MKNITSGTSYVEASPYIWTDKPRIVPARQKNRADFLVIDMFSGAGGFSVGFSQAGFGIAVALDNHTPSMETFTRNHPESIFILGDIRNIPTEEIKDLAKGINPSVIVAGIPCQGFSLNNKKRKDDDERNLLFKEFIRFVEIFQPPYVLLENVSGIRSAASGYFIKAITNEIEQRGYEVDYRVLNAANYGVPQRRLRVFFLGARPGYDIRWPAPTHGPGTRQKYNTVGDAISDLPPLQSGEQKDRYESGPLTQYQILMRQNADAQLLNHRAPNHPPSTVKKIASTKPGKPMYPRFPQRIRLAAGDLSPTQVAGGIRSQFTFGHPTQPRGLSIRERARIQSFPDDFIFLGGLVQERVQTGNAVPPILAHAIAQQIMKGLNHEALDKHTIAKNPSQMALI